MSPRPEALSAAELDDRMADRPDWELVDGERIRREVVLADFVAAFGVMAEIAVHAQVLDHHPEWSNVYNRLTIELTTHDAGGLTELDFELAGRIDAVVASRTG